MPISDLNNDHILDIVVANSATNNAGIFLEKDHGTNSIEILFANGSKPFSSSTMFSTGFESLPWNVVIGDFNNNHQNDIAFTNYGKTNLVSIALGNFNRDGWTGIVMANDHADNFEIFLKVC
ncbi:unnamed protein product [Rotaria sp. Silwood2]|nr:unnamed protein product [Rotaria sp. Silwood2]CAF4157591.1 unnamed protein product [Rotaria sp. Silwood2]